MKVLASTLVGLFVALGCGGPAAAPSTLPSPHDTTTAALPTLTASVTEASPVRSGLPELGEVITPPGVSSTQTAKEVAEKMLAVIAVNERAVGRALAPPRIIRIQLLRPGDVYDMRHLGGGQSLGQLSPRRGAPSWVVEAVGTFIDPIGRDGGSPTSIGTHGFYMWGDDGAGGYDWFPCWVRTPEEFRANEMEGQCAPPAP